MDNPETLATLDEQDTGRRQTKHTEHNTENYRNEQHEQHQVYRVLYIQIVQCVGFQIVWTIAMEWVQYTILQFIEDYTIDYIMTYRSNKTLHPPPPITHTQNKNKRPNKQTNRYTKQNKNNNKEKNRKKQGIWKWGNDSTFSEIFHINLFYLLKHSNYLYCSDKKQVIKHMTIKVVPYTTGR